MSAIDGTPPFLPWIGVDFDGTLAHYRVYASDGTTCHMQGTITVTGMGGDMTVDNDDVLTGQEVRITSWSINMSGHA